MDERFRIIVRSRFLMSRLDLDVPYSVVSISDPPPFGYPYTEELPNPSNLREILRLEFFDLDPPGDGDFDRAMQPLHAMLLWDFADMRLRAGDVLVIHCDAGVSRSPSAACAVADALRIPRNRIDFGEHMRQWNQPRNLHVYRMVKEAAEKQ